MKRLFCICVTVVCLGSISLWGCGTSTNPEKDGSTGTPDAGGADKGGTPDTPGTPPGSIEPTTGSWKYGEFGKTENNCKRDEVLTNGDGSFQLTNKGSGSFVIQPPDGTDPFNCTLNGTTFTCPERAAADYDTGLNANMKVKVKASGTFANNNTFSGIQEGRATCEGSNCAAAAAALGTTFPCTFKITFTAKH